jgi:ATP-binding cassette subfamily B (MDR/TAP) protein 1
MGNFIHYMATLIAGFTVGFIIQWRLALVAIGGLPLIMTGGFCYAFAFTSAQVHANAAYSEAGSIAEQVSLTTYRKSFCLL